jgi:hypothetical protein
MNTIAVYNYEVLTFLKSIGRLDAIIPDDIMEEVYNNDYHILGDSHSISILKGAQVIKELKIEDLNLCDISLSVVTEGYARCPKCNSDDISYERFTPDGKGEWVCWDCEWSVSARK